jgi:D-alanine-D-alanine ligase
VLEAVQAATGALARAGFSVETLGVADQFLPLVERLQAAPAVVVNFCESYAGRSVGEAYVASLLELLRVPYTGSTPEAILLCLNKIRTKKLLIAAGLPTPGFLTLEEPPRFADESEFERHLGARRMSWPLVVKPACEDASQGLQQNSVVSNLGQLHAAVQRVAAAYGFPVLLEQYVPGREFNIAVIEHEARQVLPITEILFAHNNPELWPIVTYDAKWVAGGEEDRATVVHCPADLDAETARELSRLALESVRLTGCRDYARIDLRLTPEGRPFILEVNANPDLSPSGGLDRQLAAAGISHDDFIVRLVERALERTPARDLSSVSKAAPAPAAQTKPLAKQRPSASVELRPLRASDPAAIRELLKRCGNFRPEEIEIGVQLVREALGAQGRGRTSVEDYQFVLAEQRGRLVGYTCFGSVPLTDGVWDLYWIAVDPAFQGEGIGARLQAATEAQVRAAGGRLILAETSSQPDYASARSFYTHQGYQVLECLPDFYRPGDDRITFGKRMT